jgi:hypothetical protein
MKTGRPGYRIPSSETVSRDVKKVFCRVRKRMAKMLQVGLSFNFPAIRMVTYFDEIPGL